MSLITHCPACETLFRVVPDQLRISEGWVRCGQCDQIFDASLNLLPDAQHQAAPVGQPMLVSPDSNRLHGALESPERAELPLSILIEDRLVQDHEPVSAPTSSQSVLVESADSDHLPSRLQTSNEDAAVVDHVAARDNGDEASFLRHSSSNSFWRKSVVRATLVLLGFLLLLGLSGQIVFHERDRFVALRPSLKPWLLAFCEPLDCTLSPLRQIELITIDSSSFMKIGSQVYRLNMTLKNTGAMRLALPAVEVTLTDSLDRPVVRRVFLPIELDVESNTLDAGLERPTSLNLAVKAQSPSDQITGYRLLAFYP